MGALLLKVKWLILSFMLLAALVLAAAFCQPRTAAQAGQAPPPTPAPTPVASNVVYLNITDIPGCPSYPEGLTGREGYGVPDRVWMVCESKGDRKIYLVSYSMKDGTVNVMVWRYSYYIDLQKTPTPTPTAVPAKKAGSP